MQPADAQHPAAIANGFSDATPESPPLLTPSPLSPPATPVCIATARATRNGHQRRSLAWRHFDEADDYETSGKVNCVYCGRAILATGGTTTGMLYHLKRHHPDVLATPDDVNR